MAENLALTAIANCVAACILNMAKTDGRNFSCGPFAATPLPNHPSPPAPWVVDNPNNSSLGTKTKKANLAIVLGKHA